MKIVIAKEAFNRKITFLKGVGITRTQLLDDLRNRRRYWELKEEAKDQNRWKRKLFNRT
jgi:hypothetical protein